MKNARFYLLIVLTALSGFGSRAYAQMEESRTKLQMTSTFGSKTFTTELNSFSTSISRSYDEPEAIATAKDTAKRKANLESPAGSVYLSIGVKRVTDDLIRVVGKKTNQFDGTITIVDNFGKFPTRTFVFKKAQFSSYSEQASPESYGDSYGAAYLTISCSSITINGIEVE